MIRAGPHESAPDWAEAGGAENINGRKFEEGSDTVPAATTKRKKSRLSPLHLRMLRRGGELVRLATDRHLNAADENWLRAMCDVLVFSTHGCDFESFTRLANKMGIEVDEDDAMQAIHETERIRRKQLYQPMRDDTVGELLCVTADERKRLFIVTIAAFDESEEQAQERIRMSKTQRQARWRANMTPEGRERERERRNAIDNERRWRLGIVAKPRHMSVAATEPWAKEVPPISKSTWYRRRRGTEKPVVAQSSLIEALHAKSCHPAVPQVHTSEVVTGAVPPSAGPSGPASAPVLDPFLNGSPSQQPPPSEDHSVPSPVADPSLVRHTGPTTPAVPADRARSALSVSGTNASADPQTVEEMIQYWHEQAAMLEDDGFTRDEAERRAKNDISKRFGWWRNEKFWQQFLTAIE